MTDHTLKRLRNICLALPEALETSAFGHPNFKAGKKTFVAYENFKGQDSIAFKTDPLLFDAMLLDPRFFATPYGRGQWLSMAVDADLDWNLVHDKVLSSYRLVANKRMLTSLQNKQ
ncbi:MAG: MmcQ/YjbR family DNA-binding protein [Pseudomonadota bacterium]